MNLHYKQLPCPVDEFKAKLAAYRAAREEHRNTVDLPAPFPEFELLRTICELEERGYTCTIAEPTARELALETIRADQAAEAAARQRSAEDALILKEATKEGASDAVKAAAAEIAEREGETIARAE